MSNRYAADGVEASHQPGSRRRVLANLRGIVRVAEMQQVESDALLRLFGELLEEVSDNQGFNADDLRGWHARWLGGIYPWAQCCQLSITPSPVGSWRGGGACGGKLWDRIFPM